MANASKGYFDKDLNLLALTDVNDLTSANNGNCILYSTREGRLGYMNRNFEVVIPGKYSRAFQFRKGCAWVQE